MRECGFTAGERWLLSIGEGFSTTAYPVSGGPGVFVASSGTDPESLQLESFTPYGDAVFWISSDELHDGINVWTQAGGARPFVRWIGSTTKGAGDFGSDGTDMVWLQGDGTPPPGRGGWWQATSVWTAPFTTDRAALVPRRVTTAPDVQMLVPTVVGCGYAAHVGAPNAFVVRLSDGMLWTLPGGQSMTRYFMQPIGITCSDVFIAGQFAGRWTVARVPLASLGAGAPAQ